ncbi:unnamed protein product [Rangifer tarandus platyrhynchus]|uniref:Uncharacterized protein n=1 Tax=Rangifer tarandus platyrhynchus TaxID=3082113 RepID=A0AC60A515_RANTA
MYQPNTLTSTASCHEEALSSHLSNRETASRVKLKGTTEATECPWKIDIKQMPAGFHLCQRMFSWNIFTQTKNRRAEVPQKSELAFLSTFSLTQQTSSVLSLHRCFPLLISNTTYSR